MVQINSVMSFFFPRAKEDTKEKEQVSKYTLEPVNIPHDKMGSLEESDIYELMFATKPGFPIPNFPISHSAIALRDTHDHFAVYGRQSLYNFTKWFKNGGFSIRTKMDNELPYLNKGFNFTAYPTGAYFSKKEIDDCLNEADKLINENQSCNMINSNCYSYSVTVMVLAIKQLLQRPALDSAAISQIITVMQNHPLSDHYAFGVFNNEVVVKVLKSVNVDIQAQLRRIENRSDAESYLFQQSQALSTKIAEEEHKYRFLSPLDSLFNL